MTIHITCLGLPIEGPTHVTVEPDPDGPITLRELITRHLSPRFGGSLDALLFDGDNLGSGYVILVNGRNVLSTGGLKATVGAEADVLIMPPVGGG